MSKDKPKTKTVYRDSDSGKFSTKKEAEKSPKTHEKERIKISTKK